MFKIGDRCSFHSVPPLPLREKCICTVSREPNHGKVLVQREGFASWFVANTEELTLLDPLEELAYLGQ